MEQTLRTAGERFIQTTKNGGNVGYIYFEIQNYDALLETYGGKDLKDLVHGLINTMRANKGKLFRDNDLFAGDPESPYRVVLFLFSPPRRKDSFTDTDLKIVSRRTLHKINAYLSDSGPCGKAARTDSGCVIMGSKDYIQDMRTTMRIAYKHASMLADKDRVMAELISNASHELRTPLTCIKGYTESLLDGAMEDRDLCKRFLDVINEEAGRLERLINDLLDISMIESRQIQMKCDETDLIRTVKTACEIIKPKADREGIGIVFKSDLDTAETFADDDRIKQLLIILLDNAVKYSPPGGAVTAAVGKDGDHIVISVSDQGEGIPDLDKSRVFERFYRVAGQKKEGRGLGLSIAKYIAEAHGGSIEIDRDYTEGSRFTVRIPAVMDD